MEYEFKRTSFEDKESLQKLVDLQNTVYKSKHLFSITGFKHWYVDNPIGKAISYNAFYDGEMVAHYACVPIKMKIDGRIVNGLLDIATVTHPQHRGKGLFKKLAQVTFECAKKEGYEFILGVANANSFPGYMKYFQFTFVSKLDVKIGFGTKIQSDGNKTYSMYWDKKSFQWRCNKGIYTQVGDSLLGKFKPFIHTYMGHFSKDFLSEISLHKKSLMPHLNLYIGLGAKIKSPYITVPKFIKHSPFNLIFLDLTGGKLPPINKNNIFFQLIDFDVA